MAIFIPLEASAIGSGRRKTAKEDVASLAASIGMIGLRNPITLLPPDASGKYPLVAGRHRLEACRTLGHTEIEATIIEDKIAAEMWEISENLHRAELTALQRSIQIGRWVKLTADKIKRDQKVTENLRQVGADKPRAHRATGRPRGPKESGTRAAARELGITETAAQRSVTIDGLTAAAQKEAERLGLDNNQRELERAARLPGAENQKRSLENAAKERDRRKEEAARIQANLDRSAAPKSMREVFARILGSLDIDIRTELLIWLRGPEFEAYCEETEKLAEAIAADQRALH